MQNIYDQFENYFRLVSEAYYAFCDIRPVYDDVWTPEKDEFAHAKKDERTAALCELMNDLATYDIHTLEDGIAYFYEKKTP